MGRIYALLGMSVAVLAPGEASEKRRAALAADITYTTAQQLCFAHLHDNSSVFNERDLVSCCGGIAVPYGCRTAETDCRARRSSGP